MDIPQVRDKFQMTGEDVLRDFKRFYYDLAVSTSKCAVFSLSSLI